MNTIHCRIKLNEFQDVPGKHVTPAEAVVLMQIHDPAAAAQAKLVTPSERGPFWKMISNAEPAGKAMQSVPDPQDPDQMITRERTDAEEIQRLRGKYPQRARSNAPGSHILDDLFPGMDPKLPQTFQEIGLDIDLTRTAPGKAHGPQTARTSTQEVQDLKAQVAALEAQLAKAKDPRRSKAKEPEAATPVE